MRISPIGGFHLCAPGKAMSAQAAAPQLAIATRFSAVAHSPRPGRGDRFLRAPVASPLSLAGLILTHPSIDRLAKRLC